MRTFTTADKAANLVDAGAPASPAESAKDLLAAETIELRKWLGGYVTRNKPLLDRALTLHDLGELIRRAGLAAGFIVESEYQVRPPHGGHVMKIDWVWLMRLRHTLYPIAAFEIEGRNAAKKSLEADVRKFNWCGAPLNVITLYQVDHNRTLKRQPPRGMSPHEWVRHHIHREILVRLDEELMSPGGIEGIQAEALALARNWSTN